MLLDLSAAAKRPYLRSTPPQSQPLLPNANLPVGRVPSQEFFLRYGRSFELVALASLTAALSDLCAHSVRISWPNLRICSMALASASCAVQPCATAHRSCPKSPASAFARVAYRRSTRPNFVKCFVIEMAVHS